MDYSKKESIQYYLHVADELFAEAVWMVRKSFDEKGITHTAEECDCSTETVRRVRDGHTIHQWDVAKRIIKTKLKNL